MMQTCMFVPYDDIVILECQGQQRCAWGDGTGNYHTGQWPHYVRLVLHIYRFHEQNTMSNFYSISFVNLGSVLAIMLQES